MSSDAIKNNLVNVISSNDISNYTKLYQYNNIVFPSLYINALIKGYNTLKYNSQNINMNQRYMYRPDYVSYDYYGTTVLAYMILYINDVMSITQFNIQNIIVPNASTVSKVLSQNKVNTSDINPVVPNSYTI